jgi:peptidase M28-like protein
MKILQSARRIILALLGVLFAIWFAVSQPSCRRNQSSDRTMSPAKLRDHVDALAVHFFPRSCRSPEQLDRCADYIAHHFEQAGATVEFQPVKAAGLTYRNVIGRFNEGGPDKIIVGAHYDTCGELPGADDNASAVASLLELAVMVGNSESKQAVELVAYTLEEPPYFGTELMGSAVHARSLTNDPATIRGVIVLEMVGFFSDEWGSQTYPSPLLRLLYPSRGNFIGVVGRWDQGRWIQTVKNGMKGTTDLPVYSIRAPTYIPGIDFSDHRNYWTHGFPALMITDTAYYRNPTYHSAEDTPDRLDYDRMAQVVVAVFEAINSLP